MAFQEEYKSKAYRDSEIIVDNDEVIFVKVNSYDGVKYFGPDKMTENIYNKYYISGSLYFIFDKRDEYLETTPTIYTIHKEFSRKKDEVIKILNPYLDEETFKFIYDQFPSLKEKLDEMFLEDTFYKTLRGIKDGQITRERDVQNSDDLVGGFRLKQSSPVNSMIELKFPYTEDFLKVLPIDQDDIWYIENIMSHYDSYEFRDSYSYSDDWKEGYILPTFNDVNTDKLREILNLINPKLATDFDNNEEEISKLLYSSFESDIDDLMYEYQSLDNDCKLKSERESIKNDLCDILQDKGIFTKYCFSSYYTTVKVLLFLYESTGMYDADLKTLLKKILESADVPDYYEYSYEVQCYDWPDEEWQRYVGNTLEKISEKIEESDEYFSNIEEYRKILDFIQGKYALNTRYKSPTNPDNYFSIEDIDHNTNKLTLNVYTNKGVQRRSYNLEDFKVFLSTGELF